MKRLSKHRPSPTTGIALLALFVALGGTSYAALSLTGADIRNGTLTGKDVKSRSMAGTDFRANSIGGNAVKESSLGVVPGATGAEGIRSAVVSGFGLLVRGRGDVGAARTSANGVYQVFFDRDVRGCAYSATVGDTSAAGPPSGFATVTSLATNVTGVRVRTFAGNGNPDSRPFHLLVSC